jgi:hypothetical protein
MTMVQISYARSQGPLWPIVLPSGVSRKYEGETDEPQKQNKKALHATDLFGSIACDSRAWVYFWEMMTTNSMA